MKRLGLCSRWPGSSPRPRPSRSPRSACSRTCPWPAGRAILLRSERALKRLHDVRLIEELHEKRIRLHPLVREFARSLTPEAETPEFRHACARRVAEAFEDFASLENTVQAEGVDLVQQALITALEFASEARTRPETPWPRCSAA